MLFIPPTCRVKGHTRVDGNYGTESKLACPSVRVCKILGTVALHKLYLINLISSSYPLI